VVAVSEILGMASSAVSNSYNPSPLTLGAGAYLILFFPMVVFGPLARDAHALETLNRAADFFNLDIIARPGESSLPGSAIPCCCRSWSCRSALPAD
jgi:hypothetical protein